MDWNKIIRQKLLHIEQNYPKDDFITTYADFLKKRNYLVYYQFNPQVFKSLLQLTNDLWNSQKRISRISLIMKIKSYLYQNTENETVDHSDRKFDQETRDLLYTLFRNTIEHSYSVTEKQLHTVQQQAYGFLYKIDLSESQLDWFLTNIQKSDLIFKKVLNYHAKSPIISQWAEKEYKNPIAIGRRAKFLSWILDKNPDIQIHTQELVEDIRHFNRLDRQYCKKVENDETTDYRPPMRVRGVPIVTFGEPHQHDLSILYGDKEAIAEQTRLFFNDPEVAKKNCMLWSVAFSRLNIKVKSVLLMKYYTPELIGTFVRICSKFQLAEPLNWLLKNKTF
ncbi:MAG: hypothetical protein R6U85_12310 [Salinivirgaceae bacterium]